jgi:hypothetical protein
MSPRAIKRPKVFWFFFEKTRARGWWGGRAQHSKRFFL